MRSTTIFAALSLGFSGAMAAESFRPFPWFGPWAGPWTGSLAGLLNITAADLAAANLTAANLTAANLTAANLTAALTAANLTAAALQFPQNPCEWVGGTCDPVTLGSCTASGDIVLSQFPCGPRGIVGVQCCWHQTTTTALVEQLKEWLETHA